MTGGDSSGTGEGTIITEEDERLFQETWRPPRGLRAASVVTSSLLGRRFITTGFIFFLLGGVLALLMRTQLMVPENDLVSPELYNQLFTMHGTTMMFIFAVPIMEAFAMFVVPAMLGTRDMCFPRLTAFGYWCYLFGGILVYSGFFVGAAPDGGWFMYVPLTSREYSPGPNQDFWLLGITFLEIATVAGAIELSTTILKMRAPGMSLNRMPIFAWYMLAVSFMIIFGFPPLIVASVFLEVERAFGLPFYDIARGGDPLLWQHLFWIFGHPEVYIIFLPAAGLVSAMLPAFARVPLVGYHWVVLAVVGTAFLSFGLWVHHMYTTGIPVLALSFFAGASMAVAIPSGIQVFAWIATLWHGRPVMRTPLLFIIGFIVIFVLGGLTGVMVAVVPFDWQAHDSYFLVAHFHYVLIGGMVFPLFAALIYYAPRSTRRLLSERLSKISFWLIFLGFNTTFLPMHLTGLLGMPRRVYTYPADAGWSGLNMLSTLGSYIMAIGVLTFAFNWIRSRRHGAVSSDNPWRSGGLEWAGDMPAPPYNLRSIPRVTSRDPLWDQEGLEDRVHRGEEYLATAPEGKREVLVTSIVGAYPEFVMRLSMPTFLPLWAAGAVAAIFVGLLISTYWLSFLGAGVLVLLLCRWYSEPLPEKEEKHVGKGLVLPISVADNRSCTWVGASIFLFVDAAIFASMLFSWFYLWTVSDSWPPSAHGYAMGILTEEGPVIVSAVLLTAAVIAAAVAHRAIAAARRVVTVTGLILLAILTGALLVVLYMIFGEIPFDPKVHVYGSLSLAFGIYFMLHVLIVLAGALFALARLLLTPIKPIHCLSPRIVALLAYFMVAQGAIIILVLYLSPRLLGQVH